MKCETCVIGLNDNGYPYLVPMNFGIDIEDEQVYLYFHSANDGKKIDLIKKDNRATFEMDCEHNFTLYEEKMSCAKGYASVIGHGTFEFVEEDKRKEAFKILVRHYHDEDLEINKEKITKTTLLRLKVNDMIGKRRKDMH